MRYYKGITPCVIIHPAKNKAVIMYFGYGKAGNEDIGYKKVKPFDMDIVPARLCWTHKRIMKRS